MKPGQIVLPVPNPTSDQKSCHNDDGVQREKIGGKGDQKIVFRDDHMAALGTRLEFSNPSAERPGPESVGQFMPEDIDEHRLRQQQIDYQPARYARQDWQPRRIGRNTGYLQHPKSRSTAATKWQQDDSTYQLLPIPHATILWKL